MMSENTLMRVINIGIHLVGTLIFPFGIYSHYRVDIPVDVNPTDSAYGQKFKYLTFIDEIIQASYFILALVIDIELILPLNSNVTLLQNIKDYFFATIGLPIGSFVAITFWALFFLDRDLVMPAEFDQYFPRWLNHIAHTMVIVLPLGELMTSYRKYPDIKMGLLGLLIFQIVYLIWIHIVHAKSGYWVYPILDKLNLLLRICFLGSSVLFSIGLYFLGQYLNNNVIWQSEGLRSKKQL